MDHFTSTAVAEAFANHGRRQEAFIASSLVIAGLEHIAQWCGGWSEVRNELFALVHQSHERTEVGVVGWDRKLLNCGCLLVIQRATLTVEVEAAIVDFGFRKDKWEPAEGNAVLVGTS